MRRNKVAALIIRVEARFIIDVATDRHADDEKYIASSSWSLEDEWLPVVGLPLGNESISMHFAGRTAASKLNICIGWRRGGSRAANMNYSES